MRLLRSLVKGQFVARKDKGILRGVAPRVPRRSNLIMRMIPTDKLYCVYIMTNKWNSVLYTGMTSTLRQRVYQHKQKLVQGFTKRYSITKPVWYECCSDANSAIELEKKIKGGSRQKKTDLINQMNPEWKDLYDEL